MAVRELKKDAFKKNVLTAFILKLKDRLPILQYSKLDSYHFNLISDLSSSHAN